MMDKLDGLMVQLRFRHYILGSRYYICYFVYLIPLPGLTSQGKEALSKELAAAEQVAAENKLPQESTNSKGSRPQNGQREDEEENAMLIDDNSDDEKEKDSRMKVSEDVMDEVSNLQRMFHSFEVLEVENETTIFEAMAKSPVYAEAVSKKTRMLGHSGFEFKFEVGFQL